MTTKSRLFIGWREAELRAKLDGSYDKQDDLRHELDALRAENERLTLADKQWADHVRRLSAENERLTGVVERAKLAYKAWEEVAHEKEAENERLQAEFAACNEAGKSLYAENERLTQARGMVAEEREAWKERALRESAENERQAREIVFLQKEVQRARAHLMDAELEAENQRLTLADRQWADHVKRLADDNERLRAALERLVGIGPSATLKEWRDAQAAGAELLGRDLEK